MSAFLPDLELVFGWLLAASWQASVLALAVIVIQGIFGARLNPRWRYALWLLVVLRLVLPVLPESALSLFQFAPPPPAALTVSVSEPLFANTPALPPGDIPAALVPPTRPFSFYSLLALIWLAGAIGLSALTGIVNQRFARQVANSPEIVDPELLRLFAEAKQEFHILRPIRLIENGQVQSPAIMGLFHPTLLLPVNVRENFDARELRFIFLHELAHLKRGDVLVQALIALLQILHWFNPVLWFAFRRMRIDREPATDALVLSRTGEDEKERYGLMLIKLLEHFNQRHSLATLVGILEEKDQFKRRFSLIARFTRGAYGWSLLGVLLLGVLAIACLTKAKAGENPSPTATFLITNLGRFVNGVDSLDYSQTRGDPKGEHSYDHWQEFGALQRIETINPTVDKQGQALGTFHSIVSYDGDYGYMYQPGSDRLSRQKKPFLDLTEGYSSGMEGPLLPFEFLEKRGARSSSGRVTLQTLKSPQTLATVAARAVLAPQKNRSWSGHPCVAVKIADGNDRNDSQAPVDFIAYFAADLEYYPIAYEVYKRGKLSENYCVTEFDTVKTGSSSVFRYPKWAKGFRYDSDTYHSSSGDGYSYQLAAASDLKINTLTKADFTLAPPPGGFIEDRDVQKLIKVPLDVPKRSNAPKDETKSDGPPSNNAHVQVLAIDLPESDYQADRQQIDDLVHNGYFTSLLRLPHVREIARSALGQTTFGHGAGLITSPSAPVLMITITPTRDQDKIKIEGPVVFEREDWSHDAGKVPSLTLHPVKTVPIAATLPPQHLQAVPPEGLLEPDGVGLPRDKEPRRLFLFFTVWAEKEASESVSYNAALGPQMPVAPAPLVDALPSAGESATWLSRYQPDEKETLAKAFDAANGFLASMDAKHDLSSFAPAMVDGVMHFKREDWPAYVNGVHSRYGEAQTRQLKSIGQDGVSAGADLLHDVSVTYEGVFQKGNQTATVRELVGLTRVPRYDPQGKWQVSQFVLSVKGPSGEFVYPPAIREGWAWADAAAHGAFGSLQDADVTKMPVALSAKITDSPQTIFTAFQAVTEPGGNVALDTELIDLLRDGRTDKVGAGDVDKVRELLGEGASPNAKDAQGNSALTWALNFGKDDAAVALIRAGADGQAKDANGENAAWLAAKIYYCPSALEALIRGGEEVAWGTNKQGQTILVAMMHVPAARAGKMNYLNDRVWTEEEFKAYQARERRVIDWLVWDRVDFNGKDGTTTPLMAAVQYGHAEAVRVLLAYGANRAFKDADGHTALELAKMFHPELVALLDPGK
jgi:beta-lactamase regulating signal transducer with metallopeptidase domain